MDPQAQLLTALQQQLQAQAAEIAVLQAQAAVPQVAPVLPVPPPGPFALTPALAQVDVIDMSTTAGIKLHKTIVAPLSNPFDGTPSKLMTFLEDVKQRASDCGWDLQLLQVDNQATVNNQVLNLITSHRMLSIENVRAHAAAYVGQQTRLAQDSFMLYEFLRDSLTDSARIRISVEDSKFKVNGTRDGPSYLKVVLMKFHVETNATNFHLRESLHRLPQKMKDLKSNIAVFNDHVHNVILNLAAGGETSSDLIVYLFLSYLATEDNTFKKYIERKERRV